MRIFTLPDELILNSVTVEDAVRKYTPWLKISHHRIACPFHNGHDLNMRVDNGYFYCYVCHECGDAIKYTGKVLGYNRVGAKRQLAEDFGLGDGYKIPSQAEINRLAQERRRKAIEEEARRKFSVEQENKLCEFRRTMWDAFGEDVRWLLDAIDEQLDYHREIPYDYDADVLIGQYLSEMIDRGKEPNEHEKGDTRIQS